MEPGKQAKPMSIVEAFTGLPPQPKKDHAWMGLTIVAMVCLTILGVVWMITR